MATCDISSHNVVHGKRSPVHRIRHGKYLENDREKEEREKLNNSFKFISLVEKGQCRSCREY